MAIKNLIKRGFGYNPGSVRFIPTHGFSKNPGIMSVIKLENVRIKYSSIFSVEVGSSGLSDISVIF